MGTFLSPLGIAFIFLIFPYAFAASYVESKGLTCKDHPAYTTSLKPVLVRSWYIYRFSTNPSQTAYFPRFRDMTFAPATNPSSTVYKTLDFFFTAGQNKNPSWRMYFQRAAKVHIIVPVDPAKVDLSKSATLPGGWKSEGWVKRVAGSSTLTYGIHQRQKFSMKLHYYMFSKATTRKGTDNFVDFPQGTYLQMQLKNIGVDGSFHLLISEANGTPSKPVGAFKGTTIKPNTKCPSALHDVWKTTDNDDPDTRGVKFRTWHPNWDPCYWCAYDHDHGSSPYHIFGYAPKYEYVARKNNNEPESHNGFKGFVYRAKGLFVYYSVHVLTSSMRRVTANIHTVQLVIADAATKEILVNIAHKGDFGWQSVRLDSVNLFDPLTNADKMIKKKQEDNGEPTRFRSVAIMDSNGGKFQVRSPPIVGQYEEWQTLPICTASQRTARKGDVIRVVFKEPVTGVKSLSQPGVQVDLGRCIPDKLASGKECKESEREAFVKSPNVVRALFMLDIKVASAYCPGSKNGVFYTDPTGTRVFSGPGPTHVRQYIKPGFSTVLSGRYEPVEPWVGIHGYYGRGFFHDHGYGIDPMAN